LGILVNDADIQHVSPIHALPEQRWDAVIAINLSGLVASADKLACVAAKLAQ